MNDKQPTHIRKEQKVIAWQWTGDNETTCPLSYHLEAKFLDYPYIKREKVLLIDGDRAISIGMWIVDVECSMCVYKDSDFRNLFSPITTSTEPMTLNEVQEMTGLHVFNCNETYIEFDGIYLCTDRDDNGWFIETFEDNNSEDGQYHMVSGQIVIGLAKAIQALNARGFAGE